jgi:hypothetical protein
MTSTSSCCALYPCSISIFSGSLKPTVQLFVSLTKNPRKQAVFPAKLYEFMVELVSFAGPEAQSVFPFLPCLDHQRSRKEPDRTVRQTRRVQGALTRKSRCAGEQSPERENLHGTFRRLMKVGGFLFSWCDTKTSTRRKKNRLGDARRAEGTIRLATRLFPMVRGPWLLRPWYPSP